MTDAVPTSPPPSTAGRPPGARRQATWRWSRRLLAVGAAVIAALILSFLTVDLGRIPGLKGAAERAASKFLNRPMHIGKIEVWPARGEYVLRNVVIEGLTPTDRPHLTVKSITIRTSYRTLLERQLFVDIQLQDWTMLIERWSDHHNIPRYKPEDNNTEKKKGPITYRFGARAYNGTFTYEDHTTPWSVVAPNLSFAMDWSAPDKRYAGLAGFSRGTVAIQNYLPMSADMTTRFYMEGSKVTLPHMDLKTDGADTHVAGQLDFGKWPEQSYTLNSDIDFARMKDIFFAKESWRIGGKGHFAGVFNIYKDERGRDLSGDFTSDLAKVNELKFPNLHGSLVWLPSKFAVTHADADFYGGQTRFAYAVEPLGTPTGSTQKFAADFERVDFRQLKPVIDLRGIDLAGKGRARIAMAWPSGHLKQGISGYGEMSAQPPEGVTVATADVPASKITQPARVPRASNDPFPALGPLPVGGTLSFRFDPEGLTFHESALATPTTFISFQGRTTYENLDADFPFHVTSRDWQESDRLLAAIISAVTNSNSTPVEVGGIGTFDGRVTGSLKAPRVEGCFVGDEMYAWGVRWGRGEGDVVIQNRYLDLANGVITRGDGTIRANGRFALGTPRSDGGEEINATVAAESWPLADLKVVFKKTDWPLDGLIAKTKLELHGKYTDDLLGHGPLEILQGQAWGERFDTASAVLKFNGPSVVLSDIEVTKGKGILKGISELGWDSTFSFDVAGERIAVESLDTFKIEGVPLTGIMSLQCGGSGSFDSPSYHCHADAPDLAVGDQVVGQTRADIKIAQNVLTIDRLDAQSGRLHVFTHGQIRLAEPYESSFSADFEDTSIDPYMKFLRPESKWSDFVHAVVDGTATATGPLKDPAAMRVSAQITKGTLSLYDYELKNEGPLEFAFAKGKLTIGKAHLVGKDTDVTITGGFENSNADIGLDGIVNLAILKGPGLVSVSEGTAMLKATVKGAFENPDLAGTATIEKGEFRYGTLPRLTAISGTMTFDEKGLNADGLTAKIGTGDVMFGGNLAIDAGDFSRSVYNLTATGRSMVLRYPEGFQSKVDANLTLTGPIMSPTLGGDVKVLSATYVKRFDTDATAILSLAGGGDTALAPPPSSEDGVKLTTDIRIDAPRSTLHIDSGVGTHIEGSAHLTYRAVGDRATLLGGIDLDKGFVTWNAVKFTIQSGSINFNNPLRIEPDFNITAHARPHAPNQTFDVGIQISGTTSKLSLNLSSEPWLPENDIILLLLGDMPDDKTAAETRAFKSSSETAQLAQTAAAQMLFSPISSKVVGSVIGDIPGAPTVFISPLLSGDVAVTTAAARLVVGKQISSKAYLSYSRLLNATTAAEFILLEYEQNERLSWILSRNENRTFALDFRIRHVF